MDQLKSSFQINYPDGMPLEKKHKNFILINNLGNGGAERQASYLSFLPEIDKVLSIEPKVRYTVDEEKLIVLTQLSQQHTLIGKARQILQVLKKLRDLNVDKESNLICFLQLSTIIGVIYKKLFGCKLTITIRTNPFQHSKYGKGGINIKWLQYLLKNADHVLVNSVDVKKKLHSTFPFLKEKLHLILNGYDFNDIHSKSIQPVTEFEDLFQKNNFLLMTGRLDPAKGYLNLLRIFKALHSTHPDLKLGILGEGEFLPVLLEFCKNHHLKVWTKGMASPTNEFSVFIFGFQQNPYWFYRNAVIFTFTSHYESLPNVIIESLACGLPVVSTNCESGPAEILGEADLTNQRIDDPVFCLAGIILPVFDPASMNRMEIEPDEEEKLFIETTDKLLKDPQQLQIFKSQARSTIEKYTWERISKEWQDFLQKIDEDKLA